jgi:hypothetical protein
MLLAGGTILAVTALACWFVRKDEQEDTILRQYALDVDERSEGAEHTPQTER